MVETGRLVGWLTNVLTEVNPTSHGLSVQALWFCDATAVTTLPSGSPSLVDDVGCRTDNYWKVCGMLRALRQAVVEHNQLHAVVVCRICEESAGQEQPSKSKPSILAKFYIN